MTSLTIGEIKKVLEGLPDDTLCVCRSGNVLLSIDAGGTLHFHDENNEKCTLVALLVGADSQEVDIMTIDERLN